MDFLLQREELTGLWGRPALENETLTDICGSKGWAGFFLTVEGTLFLLG